MMQTVCKEKTQIGKEGGASVEGGNAFRVEGRIGKQEGLDDQRSNNLRVRVSRLAWGKGASAESANVIRVKGWVGKEAVPGAANVNNLRVEGTKWCRGEGASGEGAETMGVTSTDWNGRVEGRGRSFELGSSSGIVLEPHNCKQTFRHHIHISARRQ